MNQGIFGFPDRKDSLGVGAVNNQTGSVKVFSKQPGRQVASTDIGKGTTGYTTAGGGFSDVWYTAYNLKAAAANTATVVANRAYFIPVFLPYPTRIRALMCKSGSTITTGNFMVGIYESDEFGFPTNNIYMSASTAVGSGYAENVIRNNAGLTPPLQGFYLFASIFDSAPTMSVVGSGNHSYGQEHYGTAQPLNGVNSFALQYDVGSFILPMAIRKQDIVFADGGGTYTFAARVDYAVVGQVGV